VTSLQEHYKEYIHSIIKVCVYVFVSKIILKFNGLVAYNEIYLHN